VILTADVSSEEDVANMVQNTVQMLGGLDVSDP
jgi:NAD(P)-dependent dehydrogenase (short-subunit alcohol dehydrogenase family)